MQRDKITDYTNREIENYFKAIGTKLDDHKNSSDKTMCEILEQVKITNGRVRRLEVWRGFITGGLAILTLMVIPIIIIVFETLL